MKKSVLVVSMMAAIAPFGLQALSLTINGNTYPNVSVTSVTSTSSGVTLVADDPLNEIGGGGGGADPGDPLAPDAFSFTAQTGVALSTVISSNTVTINGIDTPPSAISITNGEYSINGGAWTSAAGTIGNGDTVQVRHTSSASNSTQTTSTLTIGGVSGLFRSTTEAAVGACGPLPEGVEMTADLNWASTGSQTRIAIKDQIKSTRFVSTNNPLYEGQVSITSTTGNSGVKREVWISKCPGVVTPEMGTRCTATGNSTTVVYWHQRDHYYCDLELNTEYYINVRNVECPDSSCDVYRNVYSNKEF